jgi:hypothetical protein
VLCALHVRFVRADAILPNERHYPEHAASLAKRSGASNSGVSRLCWNTTAWQLWMVIIGCKPHYNSSWPMCRASCLTMATSATREGYLVTPQEIVRRAKVKDLYPRKPPAIGFHRHCRPAMFRYACCAERPIAASVIALFRFSEGLIGRSRQLRKFCSLPRASTAKFESL